MDLCGAKHSNTLIIDVTFNEYVLMKYFFQTTRSMEYAKLIS